MRSAITLGACVLAAAGAAIAQTPALETVVDRFVAYAGSYADSFATVIADEHYDQITESLTPTQIGAGPVSKRTGGRIIKSDYALTQINGDWVGYRDAYEVDGVEVRDREDRLGRLLSETGVQGGRAAAIANESARFNLANDRVSRNINVPTLVISLLQPRNRARFSFAAGGDDTLDGRRLRRITFRERERPTLIRQVNRQDQPVRGTVSVDPMTGEIWRTNLTWEKRPGGNIEVIYGHVPDIDPLVPLKMLEKYEDGKTEIRGEASYSKFRQFRTSARLITPK